MLVGEPRCYDFDERHLAVGKAVRAYGSNGWMKASPAPYIGPVTGPPNNAFNVDAPQYTILSELALPPKRLPKSASSRI